MKRADNQNRDTVLDVFESDPDQTFHYRVICPRVPKPVLILIRFHELDLQVTRAFVMNLSHVTRTYLSHL